MSNLYTTAGEQPVGISKTARGILRASAALAASNAWQSSTAIDVTDARYCWLQLVYTAGAANGFPIVIPEAASVITTNPAVTPVVGDWGTVGITDGVVATTDLAGTIAATGITGQNFAVMTYQKLALTLKPADNTNPSAGCWVCIPVVFANWLRCEAQEGSAVAVGTLAINYVLTS